MSGANVSLRAGIWKLSSKSAVNVVAICALAIVFAAPLVPAFGLISFMAPRPWAFGGAWLCSMLSLIVFCAALGIGINDRPSGLIIDNRNRVSLSKFQAAAWTVVVLSSFISAVAYRLSQHLVDPVALDIPSALLAVMGISATSLVASPAILSLKNSTSAPSAEALASATDTADKLDEVSPDVAAGTHGILYVRGGPEDARWLDMFRGEEVTNAAYPDLGKVQQFLITVVALGVYMYGLWAILTAGKAPTALPDFSQNMAWLIGISHAGYLAYKAAPHSAASLTSSTAASDDAVG